MALYYILSISVLVVLAQGSYLSSVNQESGVGVHRSGAISSGAPAIGLTRGSAAPQPQRPSSGYGYLSGAVGGSRRVPAVGVTGSRPYGGALRRPSAGALGRPNAGGAAAYGNAYQNRHHSQKPY
ncbi:uncharacterized protein LOC6552319 [Drosophila erecta]|uniref:GG16774 n=1 Tax=Drosophila erecta TaxID=7220 RepID=B3P3D8_DROER|nr:uncharacterized protein LOC6552319 [Drosophila erecta]EDV48718.1 uncharacterized protein Dere_GG16774 [Drosophila erecta]